MRIFTLKRKNKGQALKAIEAKAVKTHKKNIDKIVQTRKKADTLKEVLEQKNIVIELARVMGH